jgi:hypothetical protein
MEAGVAPCWHCGQPVDPHTTVCPNCGALQRRRGNLHPVAKYLLWTVLICMVAFGVIVLGGIAVCLISISRGTFRN